MPSKINSRFACHLSVLRVWNATLEMLEEGFLPVEWVRKGVGHNLWLPKWADVHLG